MQSDYSFYTQRSYKLTLCLSIAVFLMLFMLIFQPFGVNNYSPRRIFTLEFVGILSLLMVFTWTIAMLNEFLIKRWLFTRPTIPSIVGWSLWTFILLGLSNFFLYNYLGGWHDFYLKSAIEFVLDVGSVIIFPMAGTFFYFRYQNLHQAYQQALSNKPQPAEQESMIHFEGQGTNDKLMVAIRDFVYARAQDNYVEIVYRRQGALTKALIRTSLSDLTEKISSQLIIRCHRSYLVNLYNVRAITDGSEIKLYLNYIEGSIPVSKSYREEMKQAISQVKNFD